MNKLGLLMIIGASIVYLLIIYANYRRKQGRGQDFDTKDKVFTHHYRYWGNDPLWDDYIRHKSYEINKALDK